MASVSNVTGDVVIVGGGIVGCCIAYFLAARNPGISVIVLEPDPDYQLSSTPRSASAIRTQFNLGVNVEMSLYGYEFFSRATELLGVQGGEVDIGLEDCPYLILSGVDGVERMRAAALTQTQQGAHVRFFSPAEIGNRLPWVRLEGIGGGTYGGRGEGWIDPRMALTAVRAKAAALGVIFVPRRVEQIDIIGDRVAAVSLDDGTKVFPGVLVNAAGAKARQVALLAGHTIPVESRKRTAFVFNCKQPVAGFTQLVDPTFGSRGVYARPYYGAYLAVTSPDVEADSDTDNLEPDLHLFDEIIRPALARRVHGFSELTLDRTWAGHYEMNTLDQNGLIGMAPGVANMIFACGFSGHGVMHAPATGRGIAELILDHSYSSIDLSIFAVDRVMRNAPLDDVQTSEHRKTTAGI